MTNLSRRGFVAATAGLASAFALAACGNSSTSTDAADSATSDAATSAADDAASSVEITEEEENAQQNAAVTGILTVGFDSAYPPYGYVDDNGEYAGFDLDLAAEVASRNDWIINLEPIDWDAKDTLLNSGAINCIWNGFTVEGREDDYTFSDPYMINAQVVVVKVDSDVADLAGLAGKAVITQVDSAALDVLEGDQADVAATFASLETIGDYNTAFMQLESGAVDAVACDLSIAAYQMAAKPDAYKQLDEELSSEHYAVGLKLGDTATAEIINETLRAMDEDGTVQELCDKYAEQGIDYANWCL